MTYTTSFRDKTYPNKKALGVAGVFGPLPARAAAVAQLPAEHGAQPPLRSICMQANKETIQSCHYVASGMQNSGRTWSPFATKECLQPGRQNLPKYIHIYA